MSKEKEQSKWSMPKGQLDWTDSEENKDKIRKDNDFDEKQFWGVRLEKIFSSCIDMLCMYAVF